MKNRDIAEIFATSNLQRHTRHLFIEGSNIYSYGYHFKIAEKIGNRIALFNTRRYSQTTSCHKSLVKRALQDSGYTIIEKEL